MMIKEMLNKLPHKKIYIGIGVFVLLLLITFVIKGTHAFYNNESDTIPIVNATIGDFRPVINLMYIDSTVNQPLYTNKTTPSVYMSWSNDDITEYCLLEGNDCSNYVQLTEIDKINKYVNVPVTLTGDGIK